MENQNVEFFIKKIDFILKKFDYEGYNDIDDKYQDFLIENAQEIDALYQMCALIKMVLMKQKQYLILQSIIKILLHKKQY